MRRVTVPRSLASVSSRQMVARYALTHQRDLTYIDWADLISLGNRDIVR